MRRQELITNFLRLEAAIGLLSRARAVNFAPEAQALSLDWQAGRKRNPRWQYAPLPDLTEVRAMLGRLAVHVRQWPLPELWQLRCEELELELQMVDAIGMPSMPELSERRFADAQWAKAARDLALEWVRPGPVDDVVWVETDSPDAGSLFSQMQRAVSSERLAFRVVASDTLVSAAATGEGVIWVASRCSIPRDEVPRIVVHEVYGHALPRARALAENCELFAVGSARGNDTQEGYAVWQEVTSQTQTTRRRQELALRHLAALCVWQRADWVQTVEHLLGHGASLPLARSIALRAHRGGGLAREAVYLQAYCQVRSALEAEPNLLAWLGAGRLNLDAIAALQRSDYSLSVTRIGCAQVANSATTGM